jgi:hypothetical protein
MRTVRILMGLCLAVTMSTGSIGSSLAQTKRPGIDRPAVTPQRTVKPLTVNECKGLGGSVADVATTLCKTGKQCNTGWNNLCITEIE